MFSAHYIIFRFIKTVQKNNGLKESVFLLFIRVLECTVFIADLQVLFRTEQVRDLF